jgi:hypothetical protein
MRSFSWSVDNLSFSGAGSPSSRDRWDAFTGLDNPGSINNPLANPDETQQGPTRAEMAVRRKRRPASGLKLTMKTHFFNMELLTNFLLKVRRLFMRWSQGEY